MEIITDDGPGVVFRLDERHSEKSRVGFDQSEAKRELAKQLLVRKASKAIGVVVDRDIAAGIGVWRVAVQEVFCLCFSLIPLGNRLGDQIFNLWQESLIGRFEVRLVPVGIVDR